MALLLKVMLVAALAGVPAFGQAPFGCSYNPSIKQVDCSPDVLGTLFTTIPESATLGVERLIMTGNDISELYPGNLTFYPVLKVLQLDENLLEEFPAGLVENTSSLEELYLDSNPLTSIADGAFINLTNLRILSITDTPLTTLSADMFLGLPNLEELYLGSGQLSELPADLFQHIGMAEYIDLTNAQLQTIPEGLFDHFDLSSTNVTLSGNPWSADCYLTWIGPFLQSNPNFPLDRSSTLAGWPLSVAGRLDEVPLTEYNCYAPTILVSPSDDHILTDQEYVLTCMVDGAPFPEVTWLKDGQVLNYTDRVGLQVFDASLHFTPTELEDAGVYQCLVENVNGSASSLNATLSITESTCFDGKLSDHETDVDCGGVFCTPCNFSEGCLADSDCLDDLVCLYPHQLPSYLLYISPANPIAYLCNTPEVPRQLLDTRLQQALPEDIFAVNFTVEMNISEVEQKLGEILAQQLSLPEQMIGQVPGRRLIETVERSSPSSEPLVQLWFSLLKSSTGRDTLLEQIDSGQLKGTLRVVEEGPFYNIRLNL